MEANNMGMDANASPVIDTKAAMLALLPSVLNELYRRKADNQKFLRDITVKQTIAVTTGSGTLPATVLREFLHQANFADADNSLITYYNYAVDFNSTENFNQLGYAFLDGDTLRYRAPLPTGSNYTGNLFVTVPSTPAISSSMSFPSEATISDVIFLLAEAISNKVKFEVIHA